jgi:VWFA-related protein
MLPVRMRAALFLCGVISAFAQAPLALPTPDKTPDKTPEIASHDSPATFNSRVNLVSVPVVVREQKGGRAIGTLKKEDFQLFDRGKLQVISRFTIEKADGSVKPLEVTMTDPDIEKGEKPAPGAPIANRFVAYLFDDMHTNFGDLAQARTAAAKHIATSLLPTDRVAVYTTSGQNALEFTDDREQLREAMNRIMPRSRATRVIPDCPDVPPYMADLIVNRNDTIALSAAAHEALACAPPETTLQQAQSMAQAAASRVLSVNEADTQITLAVLKATVQRMAAMPGQRTIVLVSSGFLITLTHRYDQTEVIDRAIRSNVTISAVDVRGLYTLVPGGDASQSNFNQATSIAKQQYQSQSAQAEGDSLAELADGTGGTFFHNNNDLQEGFRRTSASPEFMYVLAFSPQNLKFDGGYHALKVTVKDTKGVQLQARRGYYAPKHSSNAAEDAKEEIRVALFSREEMSDIPVDLHTQFFKSTDQNAKLAVLAHVDLKHLHFKKADGRNKNTLSIVSAVFDRNGILVGAIQKDVEMRLKEETFATRLDAGVSMKTSFDVAPGSYIVRLVVRDSEGQTMAARNGVVEIP